MCRPLAIDQAIKVSLMASLLPDPDTTVLDGSNDAEDEPSSAAINPWCSGSLAIKEPQVLVSITQPFDRRSSMKLMTRTSFKLKNNKKKFFKAEAIRGGPIQLKIPKFSEDLDLEAMRRRAIRRSEHKAQMRLEEERLRR